jgi:hypothetical protein
MIELVCGIDRGFVIKGKARRHESAYRSYPVLRFTLGLA